MMAVKKAIFISWLLLLTHLTFSGASLLKDITDEAFGNIKTDMFPVAFVDFNNDKLTDIIMLSRGSTTLSVFLAIEETIFGSIGPHFDTNAKLNNLECHIDDGKIVGVQPADFDGDGSAELLLLIKTPSSENLHAKILWPERKETGTLLRCESLKSVDGIEMSTEPLIVDANGDNIADLFGADRNNVKGFWIFSNDRDSLPVFEPAQPVSNDNSEKWKTHSNAFIDLNSDGNADLLIAANNKFEIWENIGESFSKENTNSPMFRYHKTIFIKNCDKYCLVGQAAFADFTLSGNLSILFPVCYDGEECRHQELLTSTLSKMFDSDADFEFDRFGLDTKNLTFDFWTHDRSSFSHPFGPLTPRIGDFDMDGYPDLLLRMRDPKTGVFTSHFLLNVEGCPDKHVSFRGFQLQPEVMDGRQNIIAATYFDLNDDGMLDILTVVDGGKGEPDVSFLSNVTHSGSGYFMQVITLSGICYDNCVAPNVKTPYGTNLPGQTICYRTQSSAWSPRELGGFDSCAPQLPQSGHTPLHLPYVHFGLGLNLYFVEEISVTVTNATSHSVTKEYSQLLMPNAQLAVIPYPPNDTDSWKLKLYITRKRNIFIAGMSLIGFFIILAISIVILHWREQRQDRRELLNEWSFYPYQAM